MHKKWYSLSTAASAANQNVGTVRGWIGKGWVHQEELKPAYKAGSNHFIDADGVRRVAIMGRLLALGLPGSRAFTGSLVFLDTGSTAVAWKGEAPATVDGFPVRAPGDLFPEGETFLICPPADELPYVVNVKPGEDLGAVLIKSRARIDTAAIVHLNAVIQEIDQRLELASQSPDDADE